MRTSGLTVANRPERACYLAALRMTAEETAEVILGKDPLAPLRKPVTAPRPR